jgi:hypothetical protein
MPAPNRTNSIAKAVLIFTCLYFFSALWFGRGYFLRKFDPKYISELYGKSQYVMGQKSVGGIGDDGLYAFAGYYYTVQGGDVSAVNFEHPPLGKYLIGISEILFGNENVINILYFALLLWCTYALGTYVSRRPLVGSFAALLVATNPLFLDHLIRSQLDLPFTLFSTVGLYSFLLSKGQSKWYILSMVAWGAAFSTRFFPLFPVIWVYLGIVTIVRHRVHLRTFISSSVFVPLVYLITHVSFFFYHPSFIEFLRHKKWMLAWFSGSVVNPGNILDSVFTGRYQDTSGVMRTDDHWTALLPIVVLVSLIPTRIRDRFVDDRMVLWGFGLLYLLYVGILTNGQQKFLMPVYPVLTILAVQTLATLPGIIRSCLIAKPRS